MEIGWTNDNQLMGNSLLKSMLQVEYSFPVK